MWRVVSRIIAPSFKLPTLWAATKSVRCDGLCHEPRCCSACRTHKTLLHNGWCSAQINTISIFAGRNVYWLVGCWEFYVLATSKVTSGWLLTCDSVHSSWLYSAAPLKTMIWYPTQSHYPDTEPTSPFPSILTMPSFWLGSGIHF